MSAPDSEDKKTGEEWSLPFIDAAEHTAEDDTPEAAAVRGLLNTPMKRRSVIIGSAVTAIGAANWIFSAPRDAVGASVARWASNGRTRAMNLGPNKDWITKEGSYWIFRRPYADGLFQASRQLNAFNSWRTTDEYDVPGKAFTLDYISAPTGSQKLVMDFTGETPKYSLDGGNHFSEVMTKQEVAEVPGPPVSYLHWLHEFAAPDARMIAPSMSPKQDEPIRLSIGTGEIDFSQSKGGRFLVPARGNNSGQNVGESIRVVYPAPVAMDPRVGKRFEVGMYNPSRLPTTGDPSMVWRADPNDGTRTLKVDFSTNGYKVSQIEVRFSKAAAARNAYPSSLTNEPLIFDLAPGESNLAFHQRMATEVERIIEEAQKKQASLGDVMSRYYQA